jgi:putative aldouronate transport system substrate-binding protein
LQTLTNDRMVAIITGREQLSSFDAFVNDWRSRGGDQMRKEYEQELKG